MKQTLLFTLFLILLPGELAFAQAQSTAAGQEKLVATEQTPAATYDEARCKALQKATQGPVASPSPKVRPNLQPRRPGPPQLLPHQQLIRYQLRSRNTRWDPTPAVIGALRSRFTAGFREYTVPLACLAMMPASTSLSPISGTP